METRQLGNSDLQLTCLGFGSWAIGGGDWAFGWGDQDENEAIAAIVAAVDLGINWIDTAAVYGGGVSEEIVGKALKQLGSSRRPIIATKCGRVMRADKSIDKILKRQSIIDECEGSLRRLEVDCIDLYQMHWPEPDADIEEGWTTLVELKTQGKVREIGVSNHNVSQMQRLQAIHPICSLQPPYSMLNRSVEKEILPYCGQNKIGVVCYSPMAKGLLTGSFTLERIQNLGAKDHRSRDPQFQSPNIDAHLGFVECLKSVAVKNSKTLAEVAIAWVLRRPEVTSAIVGSRRPSQIEGIIAAGSWRIPEEDVTTIEQLLAMFDRLSAQVKDQKPEIDFDLWTVTQYEKNVSASGPFKFGDKDCYAEFQFVDDSKLIGFSFYGPSLAESTMSLFRFPESIAETGKRFWTALLSEQAEAAHAMLDKDFQSQFSLEELKKQLAEPEAKPSKFKNVTVDWVRMSNQIARPVDLMATVFLTAEFEDGEITQVACDIALPEKEGEAVIYDFTNEFEIDFSVASIPTVGSDRDAAALVIEAFQSDSSEKLLSMINPGRREAVDQASLTAYLKNLRAITGQIVGPTSIARIVDYQTSGKRYRCNFNLQCQSGEALPVEVWIYQGYLERFVVSHPRINDFVNLLSDKKGVRARVDSFAQALCRDVNETRLFMVSSLHTERTMTTLNSMKEQLETAIGKLEKLEIVDEKAGEQPGELEFLVSLRGDRGEKKAKVLVDVGAFGGLVSAVSIQ